MAAGLGILFQQLGTRYADGTVCHMLSTAVDEGNMRWKRETLRYAGDALAKIHELVLLSIECSDNDNVRHLEMKLRKRWMRGMREVIYLLITASEMNTATPMRQLPTMLVTEIFALGK